MIRANLKDERVRRALRDLERSRYPRATSDALNKTAFEMRDAEGREVASVFDFSGPSTRSFLTRGFRFDRATPRNLRVRLFPLRRTARVLEPHVEGDIITAAEGGRLTVGGRLAVPIAAQRGARGKVRKRDLPSTLLGPGGKGFISRSGRALLSRTPRGVQVMFALVERARLRRRFRFFDVAVRTARREFPRKARQVLQSMAVRRG